MSLHDAGSDGRGPPAAGLIAAAPAATATLGVIGAHIEVEAETIGVVESRALEIDSR